MCVCVLRDTDGAEYGALLVPTRSQEIEPISARVWVDQFSSLSEREREREFVTHTHTHTHTDKH